jgi:hypothetical protein
MQHIRSLLVRAGASSAIGDSRPYRGTASACIARVSEEAEPVDLIFFHHDSDSSSHVKVYDQIVDAAKATDGWQNRIVPVVPVQELEAWLLTDEQAIRDAVGRSSGRTPLGLPKLKQIEARSSPKELLQNALLAASEASGAKRRREIRQFGVRRSTLINRLDLDGSIRNLPSWRRFNEDLVNAVLFLDAQQSSAGE